MGKSRKVENKPEPTSWDFLNALIKNILINISKISKYSTKSDIDTLCLQLKMMNMEMGIAFRKSGNAFGEDDRAAFLVELLLLY